jgi:predicted nucleic acid-binding Zn ribbon protein
MSIASSTSAVSGVASGENHDQPLTVEEGIAEVRGRLKSLRLLKKASDYFSVKGIDCLRCGYGGFAVIDTKFSSGHFLLLILGPLGIIIMAVIACQQAAFCPRCRSKYSIEQIRELKTVGSDSVDDIVAYFQRRSRNNRIAWTILLFPIVFFLALALFVSLRPNP